jgi:hypothetical protein
MKNIAFPKADNETYYSLLMRHRVYAQGFNLPQRQADVYKLSTSALQRAVSRLELSNDAEETKV